MRPRFRRTRWRRRYTRRRTVRRRRRPRVTKRRRRAKQVVRQWAPPNRQKCIIYGWAPGMFTSPFQRYKRFMFPTGKGSQASPDFFAGGGVTSITFGLGQLYSESKLFRNRWSHSNDGYDLCRYRGTRLIFYPMLSQTYIVSWDPDYRSFQWGEQGIQHPMIMLQQPYHKIVWSKLYRPGGKAKRIFIKPPAVMKSEWYWMSDMAEFGLFQMYISYFEPNIPFMAADQRIAGVKLTNTGTHETIWYCWWKDNGETNQWRLKKAGSEDFWHIINVPFYVLLYGLTYDYGTGTSPTIQVQSRNGCFQKQSGAAGEGQYDLDDNNQIVIAKAGPFTIKRMDYSYSLWFLYQSFWEWGGSTPGPTYQKDPSHIAPKPTGLATGDRGGLQIYNPRKVSRGVLHPWDLQRDGLITKKAMQRLIAPSDESDLSETEPFNDRVPLFGKSSEEPWQDSPDGSSEDSSTSEEEEEPPPPTEKLKRLARRLRDERCHRKQLKYRLKQMILGLTAQCASNSDGRRTLTPTQGLRYPSPPQNGE